MTELELKFDIDNDADIHPEVDRVARILDAMRESSAGRDITATRLVSSYYDTDDQSLASHKVALRVRKAGDVWEQTLKGPSENPVDRLEENVPRPGEWPANGPPVDVTLHDGTQAGDRLRKALSASESPALVCAYTSDFERRSVLIEEGDAVIEVALDQGKLIAGDRSRVICELEMELKSGDPAGLFALAHRWIQRFGLWQSTSSKAARGDQLARGLSHGPARRARIAAVECDQSARTLLRRWSSVCLEQILDNASEIAAGNDDPACVHQFRVGIRRLRSIWREIGDAAPEVDPGWQAPVVDLFHEFGALRDPQAALASVAQTLARANSPAIDLPSALIEQRPLAPLVRDQAFQTALVDLLAFSLGGNKVRPDHPEHTSHPSDDPPTHGDREPRATAADKPGVKAVKARLNRLHRRFRRDDRAFDRLDDVQRHKIRKRLKRVRYLSELAAPLFDDNAAKRYLKQLRRAQQALGRHNDLVTAIALYQQAAEAGVATAWFAVGWLKGQLPASARQGGKALHRVAAADKFW